jgi:hypothetical protein
MCLKCDSICLKCDSTGKSETEAANSPTKPAV